MSKFTESMVDDFADKLQIGLTREENKMVLDEMDIIEETVSIVDTIPNIETVEPMTHCLDNFAFELRDDEAEDSTDIRDLLANCDDYEGREVQVPKVVG